MFYHFGECSFKLLSCVSSVFLMVFEFQYYILVDIKHKALSIDIVELNSRFNCIKIKVIQNFSFFGIFYSNLFPLWKIHNNWLSRTWSWTAIESTWFSNNITHQQFIPCHVIIQSHHRFEYFVSFFFVLLLPENFLEILVL